MKKFLWGIVLLLSSCASVQQKEYVEPSFERLVEHVRIVEKTSNFVIYEYINIRIDEVAPLAALYCNDKANGRQAELYNIELRPDNRRRATFICK
ncbi:MAG: hypothetical protein MJ210_03335 [Alphaproteobacteria bacterium]|nr:hypothetical protein [Alphaproteobacteria bacterium]